MNSINIYHEEICDMLKNLFASKNADYGDSFGISRTEIPYYTLGKLTDKYSRIKNLMLNDGKREILDEAIEDTLLDLANYAIMELAERKMDASGENKRCGCCCETCKDKEIEEEIMKNDFKSLSKELNDREKNSNNESNTPSQCCVDMILQKTFRMNGENVSFKVEVDRISNAEGSRYHLKFYYPSGHEDDNAFMITGAKMLADYICESALKSAIVAGLEWDDNIVLYDMYGHSRNHVLGRFVFAANALYDNYIETL